MSETDKHIIYQNPHPVFVASPYRGNMSLHLDYAEACEEDSISRNEVPFLPHKSALVRIYDDNDPAQREKGINAGKAVMDKFKHAVFYTDIIWSDGMLDEYAYAKSKGYEIEKRIILGWEEPKTLKSKLEKLLRDICKAAGVSVYEIRAKSRKREYHDIRIIFCYMAREIYHASYELIDKIINRKYGTARRNHQKSIRIPEVWAHYNEIKQIMRI